MCRFLRNPTYRELLVDLAIKGGHNEYKKVLGCWGAQFAKWRWGTVASVSASLQRIRPALTRVWDPKRFSCDSVVLKAVDKGIKSSEFWDQNKAVACVSNKVETERGWIRGCSCHEKECYDASLKGEVFECAFKKKSVRAPELHDRIQKCLRSWRDEATQLAQDSFNSLALYREVVDCHYRMIGLTSLKFGFTDELPCVIWRCRDRAVMKSTLARYRKACSTEAGRQAAHRVMHRFFSPDTDNSLLADCEDYIETGNMSPLLDNWLCAYESVFLDDSAFEGLHRDITLIRKHATASKVAYHASTSRLGQNLVLYDGLSGTMSKQFLRDMSKHKALMQQSSLRRVRLRSKKVRDMVFNAWFYRYGTMSMSDWAELKSLLGGSMPPPGPRQAHTLSYALCFPIACRFCMW